MTFPRSVAGAVATVAAFSVITLACSSAEKLQGEGGQCFLVGDCQEGLQCVTQQDGTRRCTSDLSSIQDPAMPSGGDAGPSLEAGAADDSPAPPAQDGAPPAPEAAPPSLDAVAPPPADASPPPAEASPPPPPPEAGPPAAEASTPPQDASTPPEASAAADASGGD